jgi:hypothetical protein
MLHELPDLSRLLDSAPARSNYGSANLITLVRLRDEVRQSMLARWPSRIWKGTSSPRRRLLQPDGESHETCFKRLRRWCSNSATVYLRWRKPLPTSAMVRRASRNAEFCPALRRPRCARRHMASLGGLRYSAGRNGACGRRRAKRQIEAGGQRFSEGGLWRPVSTSWPWTSSLSRPAASRASDPKLITSIARSPG